MFLSVALAGCGAGRVMKTGSDTYSVSASGAGFSTDGVKADVYKAANQFCDKKKLVMVEVDIKTQVGALGRNPPSADLKFRCLVQGDPEINRRATGMHVVAVPVRGASEKAEAVPDKYAQLKQLKELLDSGALNQQEFDEQKAKILAR